MGILFALAKALEARDDDTASHSMNVTKYAMLLGRQLGLDDEEMRILGQGAMLHDLGKIGIPDEILKKPGDLDEIEFARIKEHTLLTSEILAPLETSNYYSSIARSHHERWDGNGYPDGLDGENIPLLARIVAVADAWDAMTSNRVYRAGMSEPVALEILEKEKSWGQWDPYLIEQFIKVIRKETESSNSYSVFEKAI
ncbi:MAG: HD-GYP domain-containing protein [Deltaproteobacteria bacterium]|jgi:putative nucleotidyltransferase with HDIG domain|nr:HD-GYP domain-containing protein [Deltaproteobacteria bacterium]